MMQRDGKVLSVGDDGIVVRFERAAACGGCRAEKVCGSANTTASGCDQAAPAGPVHTAHSSAWPAGSSASAGRSVAAAAVVSATQVLAWLPWCRW